MASKIQDDVNELAREYQKALSASSDAMRHAADVADRLAMAVGNGTLPSLNGHSDDATGKRKRGADKKLKDPNAPKRPASAYLVYQNKIRGELKTKFPTLTNQELMSKIARNWEEMSEAEKKPFQDIVSAQKQEYDVAKAAYDARSPEEVAAGDAAAQAFADTKKTRKPRAPKEDTAAAVKKPVKKPVSKAAAAKAAPEPVSEEESEESEEEEEAPPPPKHKGKPTSKKAAPPPKAPSSESESESEEESESEAEPPVKKARASKK